MCESDQDSGKSPFSTYNCDILKVENDLLPEKSRKQYEKVYKDFMDWKMDKNTVSLSEDIILAYFEDLSSKFNSASLWTFYFLLKSTLNVKHDVDIGKYCKLNAFLKRKAEGYQAKKAKTFLPEEIDKFLDEAPDKIYLQSKVGLIFGIMGACRRHELYNLKFKDVHILNSTILVTIRTKSKTNRNFSLTGKFSDLCKKYMDLRPSPCREPSFFLQYSSGKCYQQKIGLNKFGVLGKTIADYLELPDPELYTGHCFRRTSATLLKSTFDGDVKCKKPEKLSEDDIDKLVQSEVDIPKDILDSIKNKKVINNLIINLPSSTSTEQGFASVLAGTLHISNCTIKNLYVCTSK